MEVATGRSTIRRRRVDAVCVAGGLAVLVAGALVVRDGEVDGWEREVFHAINGLPSWLEPPMHAVQLLGVLAVGPVVAVGALALRRPRLALGAVLATGAKLAAERTVWTFVERQRPATSTPGAIARGVPLRGFAFVSGHVVLATALAGLVAPYLRGRWRLAPWAVAGLVGYSRIYLGAHNPLDVVCGAGLGVAISGAVNLLLGVPVAERSDR